MNTTLFIIGGSGSSGTTLLKTILNRHSKIAIGPELSLFNKEDFFIKPFAHFKKHMDKILDVGMCSRGWFLYPKTLKGAEEYGWDRESLRNLIKQSPHQKAFIDHFFGTFLEKQQSSIWGEKTPSNCYCFSYLLELYPNAKYIHVVRDGRDVLASLIKRGMNPYFGTGLWLYNTAHSLRYRNLENYFELRYEDLVRDPERKTKQILDFMDLNYEDNLFLSKGEQQDQALSSWGNVPERQISGSSVGKFKHVLSDLDFYVFQSTRISRKHMHRYQLQFDNAPDMMNNLGYDDVPATGKYMLPIIRMHARDVLYRYYMHMKVDHRFAYIPGSLRLFC